MNFADLRFWGILLASLAVIGVIHGIVRISRPQWLGVTDRLSLLALGLVMLASVSMVTFIIFMAVALFTYWATLAILRKPEERRGKYLWFLIPLQLGPLLYYKYAGFIANDVLGLQNTWFQNLVIPAGISFYTFQKVAFLVDTLAFKHPAPRFLDYMNFAAFFPQIVAGPIERRQDLLPQMERFRFKYDAAALSEGACYIGLGLFFKACLADNLATFFSTASADNAWEIWRMNVIFGLRIYYDFAGYSLVALGLARCLGIRLTLNFASPYCSRNVTEFWRRWHITLSQWFRDYIYVPMGGGRVRWWMLNVALVFLVSGFWHGAGWNFVAWGAFHGFLLILHRLFSKRLPSIAPLSWAFTLMLAMGSWLFFYETRGGVLLQKLQTLVTPSAYGAAAFSATMGTLKSVDGLVLVCLLGMSSIALVLEALSLTRGREAYHYLRRPAVVCILVALTVFLAPGTSNAFIYFAF